MVTQKHLIHQLRFELKSLLGRTLLSNSPSLSGVAKRYLNLGCGANRKEGYINADFFNRFRFWENKNYRLEWQLDFRYPLNCPSDSFDGIYAEHALEHLSPMDAEHLLSELFRVLKPGALIRLVVPDLRQYIDFYCHKSNNIDMPSFKSRFRSGCDAIRNIAQSHGHQSLWDELELTDVLTRLGFCNISKQSYLSGNDSKLLLDSPNRQWESLYIEAQKPSSTHL